MLFEVPGDLLLDFDVGFLLFLVVDNSLTLIDFPLILILQVLLVLLLSYLELKDVVSLRPSLLYAFQSLFFFGL